MHESWIDELNELHEADKKKQQEQAELDLSVLGQPTAADILRSIEAVKLLKRVQNVLLRGGGTIDVYERRGPYDRAVTLVWQGPISAARKPNPEDPSDYYFIAVGVKGKQVFVNDNQLTTPTPDELRKALVEAAKQPGHQKNKRAAKKRLNA